MGQTAEFAVCSWIVRQAPRGSLAEVETQVVIAQRLGYMIDGSDLDKGLQEIRRMIIGLKKSLEPSFD